MPNWLVQDPAVIARLFAQLKLQPPTADLQVPAYVLPVAIVSGGAVGEPKMATVTVDLSGAAGTFTPLWPVPAGKRWTLVVISSNVSNPKLKVRSGGVDYQLAITVGVAAFGRPISLMRVRISAGDILGRDTDGVTAAAVHDLFYEEESIA